MAPRKEERAQHHEKWWHTLLPPKKIHQKVVLGQQIIKTNKKRAKARPFGQAKNIHQSDCELQGDPKQTDIF